MPATTLRTPRPETWSDAPARPLSISSARTKTIAVAAAALLALTFRVSALATYGFSEDEINKVNAVEEYRSGRLDANAEHPMLMKVAMWASLDAARAWNRVAPPDYAVPAETALRLPNAIAGAATAVVVFGITDLLFGGTIGVVASLIWAFDVNAIAINRIGKEDTFLLFFFLLAIYCYERAKQTGIASVARAQRWYTLSGASFGLMLASKYMPHYLGIYALFNTVTDPAPGANKPNRLLHYAAMGAAFVLANPVIVMPETWRYMTSYVRGDLLAHHGYLYQGALYLTNVPISPLGVPVTYYLRLIATKVPLVVLAALVPGAIEMIRRRADRGFVLLRVALVFLLVPYSLMAAKFIRYSLPMLAVIDVIAAVGLVTGIRWLLRKQWLPRPTRLAVAAAAVVVFSVGLVWAQQSGAPFYSLFQNGIGAAVDPRGDAFAEETYDYGVREAVSAIAAATPGPAAIVSDAPSVVAHYLDVAGRSDIVSGSLSSGPTSFCGHPTWLIVQDEHLTFENRLVVEQLRAREQPWRTFRAGERIAALIYQQGGDE
jgi:Dolichyl-phosphate-mannose-protein mannosyltransferase